MIMCVLLCYPVSIRIYYQQGVLFLVFNVFLIRPAIFCFDKFLFLLDFGGMLEQIFFSVSD